MPGDNKTQIIIAALGLAGVLGAAIFSNWDKLEGFTNTPPPPTRPPAPPVERVAYGYPFIQDPAHLTKSEVRDLAKFHGLLDHSKVNPHLRFAEGDISYWYEQSLHEKVLNREFESRRIALERADQNGQKYDTQGDLSQAAKQIASALEDTER
jgi:hypothetical protein